MPRDMMSNDRVVKIRVQAVDPQPVIERVVSALEDSGYQMIEISKEYPVKEEPGLKRVFTTAIKE